MRFLSVCSGIEAASVAWEPLGWEPVAFAEIEPFPNAVLAHRFPGVPNLGDFTKIGADDVGPVDLIVGGTPCQDFSVAGLRAGLDGARGALTVEFVRLLERVRPRWMVWENVPGVLSVDDGRAFGTFLGLLGQLGYGFAYRVLDAQHFGVPQRRRRVFVVGYLGDWRPPAAVLFERACLSGHPAPSREAGAIASALTADGLGGGGPDDNLAQANHVVAALLTGKPYADNEAQDTKLIVTHSLRADGFDASEDGTGRGTPLVAFTTQQEPKFAEGGPAFSLTADSPTGDGGGQVAVALNLRGREGGSQFEADDLASIRAASRGSSRSYIAASSVRRLTPRECERLQGFPDDWTAAPYRGKPAADGPRYRALGNSMAVPVVCWIGERIAMVEAQVCA